MAFSTVVFAKVKSYWQNKTKPIQIRSKKGKKLAYPRLLGYYSAHNSLLRDCSV